MPLAIFIEFKNAPAKAWFVENTLRVQTPCLPSIKKLKKI